MSSFGVTPSGFVSKTIQQIEREIIDSETANISPNLNTQSDSIIGVINGIFSDLLAQQWEVAQEVYSSQFRSTAVGAALDGVGELTGVRRLGARPSTSSVLISIDDATTVPIGTVISVSGTGQKFVTTEAISNTTGDTAEFVVSVQSEDTGPIPGPAGTISDIQTTIVGLNETAATVKSALAEPFNFSSSNSNTLQVRIDNGPQQTIDIVSGVISQTSSAQEGYNMLPLPGTLNIAVDNAPPQTITFQVADFPSGGPASASAAEVAARINADLAGGTASDDNGFVKIISDTVLPNSSIRVTGGSKSSVFSFPNPVAFSDPSAGTSSELAAFASPLLSGGSISPGSGLDAGRVLVSSDSVVGFSSVRVTGGTSNSALGFENVLVFGTPSNPEDAVLGSEIEDDASYRTRQTQLLSLTGAATINAIRSDLLEVNNVESVSVTENVTNAVDALGRFPKSIEIVIDDPLNDPNDPEVNSEIGLAILNSKAGGIDTSLVVPSVTSDTPELYALSGGETLALRIDGEAEQSIAISIGPGVFTAAAVADDINTQFSMAVPSIDATASSVNISGDNHLRITSNSTGSGSAVLLVSGTAISPLGLENKYQVSVDDSQGIPHVIRFARPSVILIYVDITVETDPGIFSSPSDAIPLVQAAMVTAGNSSSIGQDVRAEKIKCSAFTVPGVIDVLSFSIGDSPSPTLDVNIEIPARGKASFQTSNIVVTAT